LQNAADESSLHASLLRHHRAGAEENDPELRPEDRRELIEEAADIQRYRLKIEEAQTA
jgi:hypothetical protein